MSNGPPPTRRELAVAGLGSVAFIALGIAMLLWGEGSGAVVAWISVLFGAVGLLGVGLRMSGRTLGPSAEALGQRRADKEARQVARAMAARKPVHHKGPLPELSVHRQKEVRRTVRVMAAHGLFAPEVPDAALLYAGVAEQEESVKPDSILNAMGEADYYHPGTDPARWMANLLMHGSHAEQDEAAQIAEIAALAGDALDVRDVTVRHGAVPGHPRAVQVDVAMTVNGEAVALSYIGDAKYLSTHIHHALATRLREGDSGKRLAALWIADQGVWISLVVDGAVEALNAALKLVASNRCEWSWLDEGEPMAAGQLLIEQGLR